MDLPDDLPEFGWIPFTTRENAEWRLLSSAAKGIAPMIASKMKRGELRVPDREFRKLAPLLGFTPRTTDRAIRELLRINHFVFDADRGVLVDPQYAERLKRALADVAAFLESRAPTRTRTAKSATERKRESRARRAAAVAPAVDPRQVDMWTALTETAEPAPDGHVGHAMSRADRDIRDHRDEEPKSSVVPARSASRVRVTRQTSSLSLSDLKFKIPERENARVELEPKAGLSDAHRAVFANRAAEAAAEGKELVQSADRSWERFLLTKGRRWRSADALDRAWALWVHREDSREAPAAKEAVRGPRKAVREPVAPRVPETPPTPRELAAALASGLLAAVSPNTPLRAAS